MHNGTFLFNVLGMLQIILDNMPALAESVSVWCTPLIYAVNKGYVEAVQYFLNKFPNLVTTCTDEGVFPIHAAIMVDNICIVKEILSHYPEAMNQEYTNEYMFGGWRPLSYATYMGRLSIVRFMLTNFPEYATKCDSDRDFPIHWTFGIHADESVDFLKEFISCVPETLYQVNERGETILHLVVRYTRPEYLSYLKTLPEFNNIFHLKNVDGNTFLDLMKQKMEYHKSHPEAQTFFKRMKEGLERSFKFQV